MIIINLRLNKTVNKAAKYPLNSHIIFSEIVFKRYQQNESGAILPLYEVDFLKKLGLKIQH